MACVIWLTGISGAGKTTLGMMLSERLKAKNKPVEFLDGNIVRDFFENDLGFTRQERILNVKRIAFAAKLLAEHGVNVIVANIAPYYEVRDFIRRHINNYIQIYLKTSLEEVQKRDIHGHYKKYKSGELKNLIGVDDSYDVPRNPDLVIDTTVEEPKQSFEKIMDYLEKTGI
jgi:adenylyl-sulfate kinase